MSEVKIIRNDTGLDFKRIEQFIKLFTNKINSKLQEISRQQSTAEKTRKLQSYEHFGLTADVEAIQSIDHQIDALKTSRKGHEEKIRDFTQIPTKRYNSYDDIREGSPIHQFIKEGSQTTEEQSRKMRALIEPFYEEIWFAKDIDQAITIYERFTAELESVNT